ncbi:hypothetical protein [Deinococcus yunweiensis]|uniref:hypothetical protein n=1 Tax=Deinococcus yunweiensis TaxID=367282 RepID=UPI00398F84B6
MTFTANAVPRNQGRGGHFGMAAQAEPGTYVPPTNYVRETGGSGFLPDVLERQSQAFRGSVFEAPADYAGTDYQGRSVTVEASIADLMLFMKLMFGTPDAGGIITPANDTQWADYLPEPAFSGQWYVPGAGHVQITDGQLHELQLTVPEARTEFVTAQLSFHAIKAVHHPQGAPVGGFTPAVPVIPGYTGGLGRLEHTVSINNVLYVPDGTSMVRLYNPVEPLPANGEFIGGFAPSEQPVGAEFQLGFPKPIPAIVALGGAGKAFVPVSWKLQVSATKLIEITAQCQVTAREVPVSPGRVRTTATLRARQQTVGTTPLTITVKNT